MRTRAIAYLFAAVLALPAGAAVAAPTTLSGIKNPPTLIASANVRDVSGKIIGRCSR